MKMKTEVIIYNAEHYNMTDNKGLSVLVLGDVVQTNNKHGVDLSVATVPNYDELSKLTSIPPEQYPAKFEAELSFGSSKNKTNKTVTTVQLKNLKFLNSVEFVDKKTPVSN